MNRKIAESVPDKQLQKDLEKYRQRALKFGATDAKIITTDIVVIDERVRAKCGYPKCESYGTNAFCPPYAMDLEETRKLVNNFQYAIFFRIKAPTETMAGTRIPEQLKQNRHNRQIRQDILSKIESEAFYDGYYLAVGFGGGPCKDLFCPDIECSALIPGQSCRHSLKARSAMEAVGVDVYLMSSRVGWDIYPLGRAASQAPHGALLGIVLIY